MPEPIQKSVILNDVEIPIAGDLVWMRLPPYSAQILTGPTTVQDYAPTTKHFVDNMKSGMGIEKWEGGLNDRYWYAENVDASRDTTVLGPLVTTMGTYGAVPVKIIEFADKIWAIGHNNISYWDGSAWQVAKNDFPNPTDALVFNEIG